MLKLVAGRLSRVTGGGQAYRFGGEEFIVLFSGKTTPQVVDHLEQLRVAIELSRFHLRGVDRRQAPRGPDRRSQRPVPANRRKADAIPAAGAGKIGDGSLSHSQYWSGDITD